jgi:aryl-alcohol dehydrogenase-like predicted oxidoreductase
MAAQGIKPVFGGGSIGDGNHHYFKDESTIEEVYKLLKEGGCDTIDTARIYGTSEEWIGKTRGGDRFIIDSKTPGGFVPGVSTSAGILQHAKDTVDKLGVKSVRIIPRLIHHANAELRWMYTTFMLRIHLWTSKICSRASMMHTKLGISNGLV